MPNRNPKQPTHRQDVYDLACKVCKRWECWYGLDICYRPSTDPMRLEDVERENAKPEPQGGT